MPFQSIGNLKYYKFSALDDRRIYHAVFTRQGGYSLPPWKSLNFGASVGDNPDNVIHNRSLALSLINIRPESVFDLYQVHSTTVVLTEKPLANGELHQKADAILTNQPGVTLMMRFADCVPILLYDPTKHAIGIVHAGWVGTVGQIAKNAVDQMTKSYGSKPEHIIAAIGPSIGPDHYAIGEDVEDLIRDSLEDRADNCIIKKDGITYLDLWKANQVILNDCGVTNIETSGICTSCNLEDWYSHRGENGITGRFGIIFGLYA